MYSSVNQVQEISWAEIRQVIKTKGIGQAMLLLPLLFASSGASNQLHSMPGAEFRKVLQIFNVSKSRIFEKTEIFKKSKFSKNRIL